MCEQMLDRIVNEHHTLLLNTDRVDSIVLSDERAEPYPIKSQLIRDRLRAATNLWRGCVSVYALRTDGRLTLEKFTFPHNKQAEDQVVNEVLEGDFWLVLQILYCTRLCIPFEGGRIVTDESRWVGP